MACSALASALEELASGWVGWASALIPPAEGAFSGGPPPPSIGQGLGCSGGMAPGHLCSKLAVDGSGNLASTWLLLGQCGALHTLNTLNRFLLLSKVDSVFMFLLSEFFYLFSWLFFLLVIFLFF